LRQSRLSRTSPAPCNPLSAFGSRDFGNRISYSRAFAPDQQRATNFWNRTTPHLSSFAHYNKPSMSSSSL
jgi:hypothetical protein